MSVVIEQRFLLGRFHATRWNQSPFEDRLGEWPPSPWRLLRALAGRWFQYQRETGDDNTDLRDSLLRALAGELPSFRLPAEAWRGPELRQYHPTQVRFTKKKNVPEVKVPFPTLALDSYHVVPSSRPIYWIWRTCVLSEEETQLLCELLRRIHYFGRAEASASMRLVQADEVEPNCKLQPRPSSASVPVLAHCPSQMFDGNILLANTDDARLSGTRIPPNTKWFQAELPSRRRGGSWSPGAGPRNSCINVIRYALDSTVLPLITETLPIAEAARRALISCYGRLTEKDGVRGRSTVFSGKDAHGNPLADHRHAYYLPTDEDGDGRLDHLTVYAARGFGPDELSAFDRLRELRASRKGKERHSLRVLLLGMGALGDYGPGPLQSSAVWVSVTPYIATRYAKTRGRNRIDMALPVARAGFLQDDLRGQLANVRPDIGDSGAAEVTINPVWDDNNVFRVAKRWRTIQFKRFRSKTSDDGGRRLAGAFRLTFIRPVHGPFCLGHSSHFGMGLFVPDRASKSQG